MIRNISREISKVMPKVDFCTMWPDKWKNYDLSAACAAHDEDYKNQVGWAEANKNLRKRITKSSNPLMGWIMWLGVSSPVGYILYSTYSDVNGEGD